MKNVGQWRRSFYHVRAALRRQTLKAEALASKRKQEVESCWLARAAFTPPAVSLRSGAGDREFRTEKYKPGHAILVNEEVRDAIKSAKIK